MQEINKAITSNKLQQRVVGVQGWPLSMSYTTNDICIVKKVIFLLQKIKNCTINRFKIAICLIQTIQVYKHNIQKYMSGAYKICIVPYPPIPQDKSIKGKKNTPDENTYDPRKGKYLPSEFVMGRQKMRPKAAKTPSKDEAHQAKDQEKIPLMICGSVSRYIDIYIYIYKGVTKHNGYRLIHHLNIRGNIPML